MLGLELIFILLRLAMLSTLALQCPQLMTLHTDLISKVGCLRFRDPLDSMDPKIQKLPICTNYSIQYFLSCYYLKGCGIDNKWLQVVNSFILAYLYSAYRNSVHAARQDSNQIKHKTIHTFSYMVIYSMFTPIKVEYESKVVSIIQLSNLKRLRHCSLHKGGRMERPY